MALPSPTSHAGAKGVIAQWKLFPVRSLRWCSIEIMEAQPTTLLIAQGLCITVFFARGLWLPYRWLVAYLAVSIARGIPLATLDPLSDSYLYLWTYTLPIVAALQVGTAIEAYRRSLVEMPGLSRVLHVMIVFLAVLTALAAQATMETRTWMGALSRVYQAVVTVLGLTTITITALLSYLRPRRRPNCVRHELILALHLGGAALLLLVHHWGYTSLRSVNGWLSVACCFLWAALLTRAGEVTPVARQWQEPAVASEMEAFASRLLALVSKRD